MITGSALPRRLNCPASEVLAKAETTSAAAEAGNDEHEELARQTLAGELPPKLAALVPPKPQVEVKLVYNTRTREARIIGEGADRNYGTPDPDDIFLSLDVLGVDGDAVIVVDWKTGHGAVESAETNGQLWGGALAACRALGKDQAIIRIVFTNQGGRCDEHEIGPLELAQFAGRLEQLHASVDKLKAAKARGEQFDTREGPWCKYCPSKHVCPSKNGQLVQLAEKGLAVIGDAVMTPERERAAYEQLVAIELLAKDARRRLESYVDDNGPIDLGGNRRFGRYVKPGNERLDGNVAVAAIREVLGDQAEAFAAVAIEHSTSKAAITRAAKQCAKPRGAAKMSTDVINRIRDLGGATHGADRMPYGEYLADKDEAAPLDRGALIEEADRLLAGAAE